MRELTAQIGAVILAAGSSSRLGHPKQLVVHQGLTLVARAARAALATGAHPVVVVVGAGAAAVRAALSNLPVVTVVNDDWRAGMGTSLVAGVRELMVRAPGLRGVLLTLADQPLVDAAALGRLVEAWSLADAAASSGAHLVIAAAAYAGTVGVPALFGRAHVDALRAIPPDRGAAPLLRSAGVHVTAVDMPEAEVDVDSPDDVARLRASTALRAAAVGGGPPTSRA